MIKISKSMNNVSLLILVTVGITCATQEIIEALRATQNSYNGNRAGLSRNEVVQEYHGYKVYEVTARNSKDMKFFMMLQANYIYDFWTGPWKGRPFEIMVPPKAQKIFENKLKAQGIKYTIKIEDVQAIIDNVDPKPTIDKEDCACNCANLEVVVNQGNVHGKCKTSDKEGNWCYVPEDSVCKDKKNLPKKIQIVGYKKSHMACTINYHNHPECYTNIYACHLKPYLNWPSSVADWYSAVKKVPTFKECEDSTDNKCYELSHTCPKIQELSEKVFQEFKVQNEDRKD